MFRKSLLAASFALAIGLTGCAPPAEDPNAETAVVEEVAPAPVVEAPAPPPPPVAAAPAPKPKYKPPVEQAPPPPPPVCQECGVIASVTPVKAKGSGSGAGAVLGGVIGGVIGHQFGGGRGKDVATAAGAIGGAVAGHQVEKQVRATTSYDIAVSMENGTTRTVSVADGTGYSVGSRVRVIGDSIQPR